MKIWVKKQTFYMVEASEGSYKSLMLANDQEFPL